MQSIGKEGHTPAPFRPVVLMNVEHEAGGPTTLGQRELSIPKIFRFRYSNGGVGSCWMVGVEVGGWVCCAILE